MDISPGIITALAGIPIGTLAVYLMYKLSSNHMNHVCAAIEKLADGIDNMTDTNRAFHMWMRGVMLEDCPEKEESVGNIQED